ncbi:MAG: filamin/ABP280 repeat domain-containing protein, partial [Cyclonatronaceae bacterium]
LSGNTNPATLVMNSDKSVTANFRRIGAPLMQIIQQPSETTAGSEISPAPAVKLSDDLGSPISGADINVSLNNHAFTSSSITTIASNQDGEAVFNNLIIETAAAGYRITFDSDVQDAPEIQTDPFDISAAAPVAENSTAAVPDGTAGEQTQIQITVRDQYDNPVAGIGDQLRVGVSGANSASPVVIETATRGLYSAVYSPAVAGTDQVAIEFAGTPISGSPYSSTVTSGAANAVEMISGDNQNGRINETLEDPFVVRVVDQSGNPVVGVTVEYTITETPVGAIGQRMSNSSATTNTDGLASSRLTLGSMPGVYLVDASAGDVGSVSFQARAELLPPSLITIVQQPAGTVAGTPIDPAPSVRVTDSENNPVEGVAIIASLNGGEFAEGSTTEVLSGADGISGFGNLVINAASSGYTLTFSSLVSGLADVTSQSFTVSAAAGDPAQSIAVVPDGVAGQETSIIIRVEDAYGNPAGSASDLTVDVAGENEDGLSVNDLDNPGEFIAVYKPETAGTDLITIRLSGTDISGSPYSSIVSAAEVDPSESTVDADPDELKVGETSTVTIVLRDQYDNLISGFVAADFVISFDGVATAGPVSETPDAGTYQVEVTSNTPGEVEVYVTAGGIPLDDSPEIEFLPEISYSIGMYIQPENSKVNQPVIGPPAVRITSDTGSVVPGIPVTVRERDGQSFASGTLIVNTGADGIARFTDLVFSVRGRYQLEFSAPDDGPINSRSFQVSN